MKVPSPVTSTTTQLQSLFVYGTLMAPAVTRTLLRRLPVHCPAKLLQPLPASPGVAGGTFRRYPVKSQVFPGLVRVVVRDSNGDCQTAAALPNTVDPPEVPIHGMLYSDLTPTKMQVLDWFEDEDEYTRTDCHVLVQQQQQETAVPQPETQVQMQVPTQVYVWNEADETQLHMDRDWSFDHFRDHSLEWFLEHTVRPCREELDRLGM
jgi:gamma-glutamylcyclotransferase (GGCT)/AIG2-like uncharacterized protein YtfP